ncbi:MAG: PRC-barrel domain-containing protein [Nanoarchaeota archaeon]|nr:PRC-barrel domain-containing protein [Nanoarchaeota archaeon]
MARFKRMSDVYDMKVFTDTGYFFGEVEEALLEENRVKSWKIKAVPGSMLSTKVRDAKGVIIPHKFFKAFGDIIIIQEVDFGTSSDETDD